MRTSLMLEISDGEQSLSWNLRALQLAPSFYKFHVDKQNIKLVLASSLYGIQMLWENGFTVINAVADIPVAIPVQVRVPCWKSAKLRRLMRGRYYIVVHVLGPQNEFVELILFREFGMPDIYLSTGL